MQIQNQNNNKQHQQIYEINLKSSQRQQKENQHISYPNLNLKQLINNDKYLDYVTLTSENFIKKIIYNNYSDTNQKIMFLYENNKVGILDFSFTKYQQDLQLSKTKLKEQIFYNQIQMQTALYDAAFIKQNQRIVVSSKNMPLRIYKKNNETDLQRKQKENSSNQQLINKKFNNSYECIGSISYKKPNSQIYLSPIGIQIDQTKNHCFAVGKKFMHLYDLNTLKLVLDFTLKNDKSTYYKHKHFSQSKILNLFQGQKLAIVGQFDGTLSLIDLNYKSNQQNSKIFLQQIKKVHMDCITHILQSQNSKSSQYYFVTSARKDDFRYLWDLRNLKSFVQYYRQPLYGNQRVGMQFDGNSIFAGNQYGQVVVFDYIDGKQRKRINLLNKQQCLLMNQNLQMIDQSQQNNINQYSNMKQRKLKNCVGSICKISDGLLCSVGGRNFNMNLPKDLNDSDDEKNIIAENYSFNKLNLKKEPFLRYLF